MNRLFMRFVLFVYLMVLLGPVAFASESGISIAQSIDGIAVALSLGFGCIGAGIAISRVGSAVVGAVSERPELFAKLLILLGLAEALAIYGLIIGVLLWVKM